MRTFAAFLSGGEEVPPVATGAFGRVKFVLSPNGRSLRFVLVVNNIAKVTQAHIHLGRRGQNGPVVAFLFGKTRFGITVGRGVVTGKLTHSSLIGPLSGDSIHDLIKEFKKGNAYVNVHTKRHPDGEIRGQVGRPLLLKK